MAAASYSGTPLLRKLGIKPETKLMLINQPVEYFEWLEADVSEQLAVRNEPADLIHLFVKTNKEFESEMKKLQLHIKKNRNIVIWVSWYKKSAGMPTDLTEDVIRNYALRNGLVDIKVCAVSPAWSGLKLVVPKAER